MPEINGYKTIDLILEELKELRVGEPKVREAIKELGIEPTIFKVDRRARYYSPSDIKRIKEWLLSHQSNGVDEKIPLMPKKPRKNNQAVDYLVDCILGLHHYAAVEGQTSAVSPTPGW